MKYILIFLIIFPLFSFSDEVHFPKFDFTSLKTVVKKYPGVSIRSGNAIYQTNINLNSNVEDFYQEFKSLLKDKYNLSLVEFNQSKIIFLRPLRKYFCLQVSVPCEIKNFSKLIDEYINKTLLISFVPVIGVWQGAIYFVKDLVKIMGPNLKRSNLNFANLNLDVEDENFYFFDKFVTHYATGTVGGKLTDFNMLLNQSLNTEGYVLIGREEQSKVVALLYKKDQSSLSFQLFPLGDKIKYTFNSSDLIKNYNSPTIKKEYLMALKTEYINGK